MTKNHGTDGGKGITHPDAGPINLDTATWTLDVVAPSPGTITHNPSLTFTSSGTPWLAYTEPDAKHLSDQDIFSFQLGAPGAPQPRTQDVNLQNAWPTVRAEGDAVHLLYSGFADGDSDIYYARHEGGLWSSNHNLTTAFEDSASVRWDYAPALAIGPGGQRAIAYLSSEPHLFSPEVRLLKLNADGTVQGTPITLIPADGGGCSAPTIAYQGNGALHVVAACGSVSSAGLQHAYQLGSGWTHEPLYEDASTASYSPMLRASTDGSRVHLVWMREEGCDTGTCQHVIRAGSLKGPEASDPVKLTDDGYFWPSLGVDPFGRLLVLFHKANEANFFELYFTWSGDQGATFSTPRNLTPGNSTWDDWDAGDWAFDTQGKPHFTSVRLYMNSNPDADTNSDILHGYVK